MKLLALLCFVLSCAAFHSVVGGTRANTAPPVFTVKAISHYDLGQQVGSHFADNIRSYLSVSDTLKTVLNIVNTTKGKSLFGEFVTASKAAYPQYYQELQGIADGARVSLDYLLMLSLQLEMQIAYFEFSSTPLACSDVHVANSQFVGFGHNEDYSAQVKKYAYILDVELTPPGGKVEAYLAYTYPGQLSGVAFGLNPHRVAFSCNAVTPLNIVRGGIGRAFINRDMVLSESIEDGIRRATPLGRAAGFSFNLASQATKQVINIEVAPTVYAVTNVVGNFSHFNNYKVLGDVPQQMGNSTVHRQARANQMAAPTNGNDILQILGDDKDRNWPIYRTGQAPDDGVTVATVLFDLNQGHATIWTDNPKESAPVLLFRL